LSKQSTPDGSPKPKSESELNNQPTKDGILRLIQKVDGAFEQNWVGLLRHSGVITSLIAFAIVLVLVVFLVAFLPPYEGLTVSLAFLGFMVGYFTLMRRSVKEQIPLVRLNYRRLCNTVEKREKPLLKALIKMKAKNPQLDLEDIYSQDKTRFTKKELSERLYE